MSTEKKKAGVEKKPEPAAWKMPRLIPGMIVLWWANPADYRDDKRRDQTGEAAVVSRANDQTAGLFVVSPGRQIGYEREGVRFVLDPELPRAERFHDDFPGCWDFHPYYQGLERKIEYLEERVAYLEGPGATQPAK